MQKHDNYIQDEKYFRAKKKVKKIQGFYIHLVVYIVINLLLTISIGIREGFNAMLEPLSTTALFWGIGLLFHWYGVFGSNLLFGKDWEERKIKELMEKDDIDKILK